MVRCNAATTTPRGCARALHQSGIPFKASNSTYLVRRCAFDCGILLCHVSCSFFPPFGHAHGLCARSTRHKRGGALAGAARTTECHLLAKLEHARGNSVDESFSFPSHEGLLHSCRRSTCAGRRRQPHPVVLKVTRAVAVLRDGGAWPVADPAPAQFLPFRRCRGVCAPKTCSLHVCVTFHCGDVPTFYAKFFFSGLCSTG